MSDGKLIFNTKIDNSGVPKDLKELERKIRRSQEAIQKMQNAKLPIVKQAEDLGAKLDGAKAKLEQLRKELSAADAAMAPGASPAEYALAAANRPGIEAAMKASEKEVAALQKQWDHVNDKIDTYDLKIRQANADIERSNAKAAILSSQMNSGGTKMAAAFSRARASADKFGKRIVQIGASMIMFRVFSAVLQGVGTYMSNVLKTNSEYTAQLAKLRGALLTAFQPIYEFVLPGILAVLRVLTAIVQVVANVLSYLTGKTAEQSAKSAKALNEEANAIGGVGEAAKKAEKHLANFDEINKLGADDSGSTGGGGGAAAPDFGDFNIDEYKAKIDALTVYLSGALLALGAILAFSGANVPLGIGLMAAGAIGLASVVKANWGTMSTELKSAVTTVLLILGTAALAIGAILAFSGASVGKGIALMAIGVASWAAAAAVNWNTITDLLQGPVGQVVAIASGALLALGLVLAFSGANLPLGIALIAAGAVGLVTVAAMNWDAILEKLKQVWAGIKQWFNTHVAPKLTLSYWKEKFSNIAEALKQKIKDGVNSGIALFNKFISWINSKMRLSWGDFSVAGEKVISAGSFQLLNIPTIPALARGAVLPANKPFLAMVGDQKNGTNIEAPLETIKQALAEVLAEMGMDIDVNVLFAGELAQLARILLPAIEVEKKRKGGTLAKGNVQ